MATLHLLSRSPFSDTQWSSCLRFLADDDGLLLMGNAVYAVRPDTSPHAALQALAENIALFALEEDLAARALSAPPRLHMLDYPGFVELCTRYARVNSWL